MSLRLATTPPALCESPGGVSGEAETASSGHFVRRIALGTHELPAGQTALSFIARDSAPSRPALIGVDQVILTPKD